MPVLYPLKNLYSIEARQKIGKPNQYGESIYAWSLYGDENIFAGIYWILRVDGFLLKKRVPFYDYKITHTTAQTTQRTKLKNAVIAWQALTIEQKKAYNKRAVGRHYFGYHLFISEYMKT